MSARLACITFLGFLLAASRACSDELRLRDGRRLQGQLVSQEDVWRWRGTDGLITLARADLADVRFETAAPRPLRAGLAQCLSLVNGDRLSGSLLSLDERALTVRTAWSDRQVIPRNAVASLSQPPGRQLVFLEDFEATLGAWKIVGASPASGVASSGQKSLPLARDQRVERSWKVDVSEGELGVNFHRSAATALARVELTFRRPDGVCRVSVNLGERLEAQVDRLRGTRADLPSSPGWHRLVIRFTVSSLRVEVDGTALWYDLKQGPGGPPAQIRLVGLAETVHFDELALSRQLDPARHEVGDPTQDAWITPEGDQLFGKVVAADGHGLLLRGHFGEQKRTWSALHEVHLARSRTAVLEQTAAVRLTFDGGIGEVDRLTVFVRSLDENRCVIQHPLLGEVTIPRDRLLRIRWPELTRK